MDIDIYQLCPCDAKKKIKFCCGKDVINDLNEVLSLNKGRQSIAALEQIDRAISKLGHRDCLLTLKTRVQLSLNRIDDADETNKTFFNNNPNHAMAHHHQSMIHAARNETGDAVASLQSALEATKTVQVPVSFANAYRILGLLLLMEGKIMTSRAHLRFAMSLRREDEQTKQLFLETWKLPGLPLLMRHEFGISDPPEGEAWSEGFCKAQALAGAGRWRKSRRLMLKLNEAHPQVPQIQKAIATLSTWLGSESIEEAWKLYAENPQLSLDEAIDATSFRLLLSQVTLTDKLDVLRFTYPISDVGEVMERAAANPQMIISNVPPDPNPQESAPLPKARYVVVDRVPAETSTELDSIPLVVAEAFVFGKQTDRPARVEVVAIEDKQFGETRGLLESVIGESIEGEVQREVVSEVTLLDHSLRVRLKVPDDVTREQYDTILEQQTEQIYLQVCPEIPFTALDGKTLRVAATDDKLKNTAMAIVSLLEHSVDQQTNDAFDFNRLRAVLGVPEQGLIDLNEVDAKNLSPALECRIPFSELKEDDLIGVYIKSMTIGNLFVVRRVVEEMLQRPEIAESINVSGLLLTLAQLATDDQQALDYAKRAREKAVAEGSGEAKWLVYELDVRLGRGITDGCDEIIRILQSRYRDDQEMEVFLIQTLQKHGLVGPQGQMPSMGEGRGPDPLANAGNIWTADQGNPQSVQPDAAKSESNEQAGSNDPSESKLWIPD